VCVDDVAVIRRERRALKRRQPFRSGKENEVQGGKRTAGKKESPRWKTDAGYVHDASSIQRAEVGL
jgi:hypothetical protein